MGFFRLQRELIKDCVVHFVFLWSSGDSLENSASRYLIEVLVKHGGE